MDALFEFGNADVPAICERCLRSAEICVCTGPYLEILADGDQRENEIYFVCATCDTDVTWQPCPEHAPVDVPGLVLAECDAAEPHARTWVLARENGYGTPCPWCLLADARAAHDGCEHALHGRWRSWSVTKRVLSLLSRVGAATYAARYSKDCRGCRTNIRIGWRRSR